MESVSNMIFLHNDILGILIFLAAYAGDHIEPWRRVDTSDDYGRDDGEKQQTPRICGPKTSDP